MRTRIFVNDQEHQREYQPPKWYRSPEEQYQRASELWPEVYIPSPPSNCMLGSSSGVLLLHVPRSITELWGLVQAPAGYTKNLMKPLTLDDGAYMFVAKRMDFRLPTWVHFSPTVGVGRSPIYVNENSAASEVLSAAIQFPEWIESWLDERVEPTMPGLRVLEVDGTWARVPTLGIANHPETGFYMSSNPAWLSTDYKSIPTVTRCLCSLRC